ncbi:MAG TPA: hypothetical protein VLH60_05535 [Sedimentisphaerales bacterium]|nr:hypothetical protein [Sedimentisphaerales bacterium]
MAQGIIVDSRRILIDGRLGPARDVAVQPKLMSFATESCLFGRRG